MRLCFLSQLKLSAGLAPIALVIMCITFPLSYPLGRLLDVLIGNDHYHNRRYSRQELMTLVQIHQVRQPLKTYTSRLMLYRHMRATGSSALSRASATSTLWATRDAIQRCKSCES